MNRSLSLGRLALLCFVGACDAAPTEPGAAGSVPVLLEVEPDLILIEDAVASAILTGEGFIETSIARVDGRPRLTTFVSSEQLHLTLDSADLESAADLKITVASAEAGGITSGEQTIRLRHANPVLQSVEPDTVRQRSISRLVLRGDRFRPGMELVLDDVHHVPVVRLSGDSIAHVDVPAGALSRVGTIHIEILPPAPGIGTLNELDLEVVQGAPRITELYPPSADAGSGPMTLSIRGFDFDPASELRWNGTPRPFTFVDSTTLELGLIEGDLATAGTSYIEISGTVTGMGPARPFAIVPSAPSAESWYLGFPSTALAPDPVRDLVYAAVPAGDHAYANHLVAIDVTTKSVAWSVPAGLHPISLAVTEDGTFAYVGLGGVPLIVRIDLSTRTKVLDIPISVTSNGEPTVAMDIETLPGKSRTIAASLSGAVAVFDDEVMRPVTASGSQRITATTDSDILFGLDPQSATQHFRRYGIDQAGVWLERTSDPYESALGGWPEVFYDGGLLFTNLGDVVDPHSFELLADFVWSTCQAFNCVELLNIVRPDVANGRIHYFKSGQLITKDASSFTELGAISVGEPAGGASHMIRYGSNGLVVGGGSLLFIESELIGPYP